MTQSISPAPGDKGSWDLFISYARDDNAKGWISAFVEELKTQHAAFAGEPRLKVFFDQQSIEKANEDWWLKILDGINQSHVFLAFISPKYFASEWCRREWRAWFNHAVNVQTFLNAHFQMYVVEVPGLMDNPPLSDEELAKKVAQWANLPEDRMNEAVAVIRQSRRRQIQVVSRFFNDGIKTLQENDLKQKLAELARQVDKARHLSQIARESYSNVPAYNKHFSGRIDELLDLRQKLQHSAAGVITGVNGLGGVGKTELAFTYAHAFADVYPGGRFLIQCEHQTDLSRAVLQVGPFFADSISDEERKIPDVYFNAVVRCLKARIESKGPILLVLDNVADMELLSPQQTDKLTAVGPMLHMLATTRLAPAGASAGRIQWLTLDELPLADALDLMQKYRPFAADTERQAAVKIIQKLGGFALSIELSAAYLACHPSVSYCDFIAETGMEELHVIESDRNVESQRHNHEKRLHVILAPTLAALSQPAKKALQYAAILPPDAVAVPWLKELVSQDFPELAEPKKGIQLRKWDAVCEELRGLALFSRWKGENDKTDDRLVRVHRLVRDLVWEGINDSEKSQKQKRVDEIVKARLAAIDKESITLNFQWELIALEAMAWLWDQKGHPHASRLCNDAGFHLDRLAQWERSEPLYRRALSIDEKSLGPDHPDVARDLNNLAAVLKTTHRLSEAEPLMRSALAIDEKSFGPDHPKLATRLNNLAQLLAASNRLQEAEPLMRRALTIDELNFGPDHPKVAVHLNNIAQVLKATNRLMEAEPLMRRALAIDEKSFGPDHPDVAVDLSNLALLLKATNRLSEAEPLMRRALSIDEKSFGPQHPKVAMELNNLAYLLIAANRLSEAEPLMKQALSIFEKSFGPDHPNVAVSLNNLSQLFKNTNRLSEAEPLMRRALSIDEKSLGPDHPDVAVDLNNLAQLLHMTQRLAEAQPLMKRAVEILVRFSQNAGHHHPHLYQAIDFYGYLLVQLGNSREQAIAILKEMGVIV